MKKKTVISILVVAFVFCLAVIPSVYATEPAKGTDYTEEKKDNVTVVTLKNDINATKLTEIKSGENVTIDLNSFTITAAQNQSVFKNEGGNLTIKDSMGGGRIIDNSSDTANYPLIDNASGTLTIAGGTLISGKVKGGSAINNQQNATLNVIGGTITSGGQKETFGIYNAGTATISGGTFVQSSDYSVIINNSTGSITINGGDFKVTADNKHNALITNDGTLNIKGGNFSTDKLLPQVFNKGTATVSGGTFSNTDSVEKYLDDGYTFDAEGNVVTVESLQPDDNPTEQPNNPTDEDEQIEENTESLDESPKAGVVDKLVFVVPVAVLSALGIVILEKRRVK